MFHGSLQIIGILSTSFLSWSTCIEGSQGCVGTCYAGLRFAALKDTFHRKHLKGHSYKNITTDDQGKCYRHCVQDCRCKACQMKDANCELLDEDKTSKACDFVNGPGYVYFDLRQTMYQGQQSHMVAPGDCYNGCCRSQPCLNGGTCVENCKLPKVKFTCKCSRGFYGSICEKKLTSCTDAMLSGYSSPEEGVYPILTDNEGNVSMYCSFEDKKRIAWTLIESFAFNKNRFYNKPFFKDERLNHDNPPNWHLYRTTLNRMQYIRSKSTLFRSTCDFDKRSTLTPDLLIGRLDDVDIINVGQTGCKKYQFIDIRGHQCNNCTAMTGMYNGTHYHIDVTHPDDCDFNPPKVVVDVDSFGFYGVVEKVSKCTDKDDSTTQWWLGKQI